MDANMVGFDCSYFNVHFSDFFLIQSTECFTILDIHYVSLINICLKLQEFSQLSKPDTTYQSPLHLCEHICLF